MSSETRARARRGAVGEAGLALARERLAHHRLAGAPFETPAVAAGGLGALQAQAYLAALWAVGLRCAGASEASVAEAIAAGQVVRTWAMRGTFQLVAAADVRWLIELVGPAALRRHAPAHRKLGVDEAAYARLEPALAKSLQGEWLTREELFARLEAQGIATAGQLGYYLLVQAALRGRVCLGPPRGKQETYGLLEEWVPAAKGKPRDEALTELARRYFSSHGPATADDFAWWSGLTLAEARAGLAGAEPELKAVSAGGKTYWGPPSAGGEPARGAWLLPAFDEFVLGYHDRGAALPARHDPRVISQNGIFYPTLVVDGEIVGTWKRTLKKDRVEVVVSPLERLTRAQQQAAEAAAARYGEFLGRQAVTVMG